jgi:hypothetical protein
MLDYTLVEDTINLLNMINKFIVYIKVKYNLVEDVEDV